MAAIVYKNIALREHPERTLNLKRARAAGYDEATGWSESVKYTDKWPELVDYALGLAASVEDEYELVLALRREGGEMGELTVTRTQYRKPAVVEDDGGGGEESEVGTAENPEYTCSFTVQAEPLLCHPMFAGMPDEDAWILQQVAAGAHPESRIRYGNEVYTLRKACEQMSEVGKKALVFYLRGITQYFEVYGDATAKYSGSGAAVAGYEVGKICTPPGDVGTPEGRSWLCTGKGKTVSGDKLERTLQFRMSGRGGWDTTLYS